MKRLLLLIMLLSLTAFAFGQEDVGVQAVHPVSFLTDLLVFVFSAGFLTFVGQQLRRLNVSLPGFVKSLLPLAFGLLSGFLSDRYGIIADFGPILGALLGTLSSVFFDAGNSIGWLKSSSD